jgi:hypothetical protein
MSVDNVHLPNTPPITKPETPSTSLLLTLANKKSKLISVLED